MKSSLELGVNRAQLARMRVDVDGTIADASAKTRASSSPYSRDDDAEAPIGVVVNSPRGETTAGLAIYDVMNCAAAPF